MKNRIGFAMVLTALILCAGCGKESGKTSITEKPAAAPAAAPASQPAVPSEAAPAPPPAAPQAEPESPAKTPAPAVAPTAPSKAPPAPAAETTKIAEKPAPVPAAVQLGPTSVTLKNKNGDVTFSHETHAANLGCPACHGQGEPTGLQLDKDSAHKLCKGCHQEGGNGPTKCADCHKK